MKKTIYNRITATIVLVAMIISLSSAMAFAEEKVTISKTYTIGKTEEGFSCDQGIKGSNLNDIIAAIKEDDGDNKKIFFNGKSTAPIDIGNATIALDYEVILSGDVVGNGSPMFHVENGVTVTSMANIKVTQGETDTVGIINEGSLKIIDGSVNADKPNTTGIINRGEATISESGTEIRAIEGTAIKNETAGKVTIANNAIITDKGISKGRTVALIENRGELKLNSQTQITMSSRQSTGVDNIGTLEIDNSEVTVIYGTGINNKGTLNITNSKITADATYHASSDDSVVAIKNENSSAKLTINNSKLAVKCKYGFTKNKLDILIFNDGGEVKVNQCDEIEGNEHSTVIFYNERGSFTAKNSSVAVLYSAVPIINKDKMTLENIAVNSGGSNEYASRYIIDNSSPGSIIELKNTILKSTVPNETAIILGKEESIIGNYIEFKGNNGTVKGKVVLLRDLKILSPQVLTIPTESSLTIKKSFALTNSGTINHLGDFLYGKSEYGDFINYGSYNTSEYRMKASPNEINFEGVTEGYTPFVEEFSIENIGSNTLSLSEDVTLNNFIIAEKFEGQTIDVNQTATFTITPKSGLMAGRYSETLIVKTSEGAVLTIPVTFTVTAKPTGGGQYMPPLQIENTSEGTVVKVSEYFTKLDKYTLENLGKVNEAQNIVIKQTGVIMTLKPGTLNKDIDGPIDFGATLGKSPNAVQLSNLAKGTAVQTVTYSHNGLLPGKIIMEIDLGLSLAGKQVYYNRLDTANNQLVLVDKAIVSSQGKAIVEQDRCSDYVFTTKNVAAKSEMKEDNPTKKDIQGYKVARLKAVPSAKTKNKLRRVTLTWNASALKLDGYQVWKSTKKYSGFTKVRTTENTKYINTKGLIKGKTYYYKARGFKRIDGKLVYGQWTKIKVKAK